MKTSSSRHQLVVDSNCYSTWSFSITLDSGDVFFTYIQKYPQNEKKRFDLKSCSFKYIIKSIITSIQYAFLGSNSKQL